MQRRYWVWVLWAGLAALLVGRAIVLHSLGEWQLVRPRLPYFDYFKFPTLSVDAFLQIDIYLRLAPLVLLVAHLLSDGKRAAHNVAAFAATITLVFVTVCWFSRETPDPTKPRKGDLVLVTKDGATVWEGRKGLYWFEERKVTTCNEAPDFPCVFDKKGHLIGPRTHVDAKYYAAILGKETLAEYAGRVWSQPAVEKWFEMFPVSIPAEQVYAVRWSAPIMFLFLLASGLVLLSKFLRTALTGPTLQEALLSMTEEGTAPPKTEEEEETPNRGEATTSEIAAGRLLTTATEDGIRLGFRDGEIMRYAGDAHGLIVAPTRTGKGRDFIQPIVLSCPHSMFIIDPKGEIPCITKAYRETLGDVFILNPYGEFNDILGPSHCYNPLRTLNPKKELDADCDVLAGIIVERTSSKDSHWDDKARSLISGLMMFLVETQEERQEDHADYEATLGELRSIVTNKNRLIAFCQRAVSESGLEAVRERLDNLAQAAKAENKGELDSITSSAERHTSFIDERIRANSARSDFRFRALTEKRTTIYVVLPDRHASERASWFRLITGAALMELTRGARGRQVLMILDEFASMKRFDMALNVMNQGAGRGLQCIPILQGLGQLHDIYGGAGDTFINNAHFKVVLATEDPATANYVSKQAGTRRVLRSSHSTGRSGNNDPRSVFTVNTNTGTNTQLTEEPVIKPFEVAHIPGDEFVVFVKGVNHMIRGKRAAYFDETAYPEFKERYQENPLAPPKTRC